MRRIAGATVVAALVAGAPAAAAPADRAAAERGAGWLEARGTALPAGQQADVIVALRSTGTPRSRLRGRARSLARAGRSEAIGAGRAAKVARAAAALGADPARFGRVNYIGRINRDFSAGRYGGNAFDHALAMIALREAGRPVPRAAIRSLVRSRGAGGWNLSLSRSGRDDIDATAIVIEAMRAAGVGRGNRALRAATRWMETGARRGGGYPSRPGRGADANSTAAVLRAQTAMRRATRARTARALRRFQQADGSFAWQRADRGSPLLATLDAVPALAGAGRPPWAAGR